jgi:murein DD-endopeptidase MepM/ murein hydrolase activator NlpD
MVTAELQDLAEHKAKASCQVQIKQFDFPKQRGFSVSEEKVAQEKEAGMSMQMLNDALEKWVKVSSPKKLWHGPFLYPIDVQRQTTPFGEIRTTSVSGRYLHKGVDLVNRPRSIVWAAQHGVVIIKDRFFTTGNTIVIDHGLGVQTLYAHLENFADIEVGQSIKKGSPLGKVGMTGYANGYHLHWELRVQNIPVDPTEWTSSIF